MVVSLDDFNLLAGAGVMESAVQDALIAKHRNRPRSVAGGGSGSGGRSGRGKVNYATLEHAGEPHRGRITEAEKELVRKNLDQINRRLREAGQREIDPSDQAMRDRYGLGSTAPASRFPATGRRAGQVRVVPSSSLQEVAMNSASWLARSCTVVRDRGKVRLKGGTSYTAWAVGFLSLRTTTLASTCSCPWTADPRR